MSRRSCPRRASFTALPGARRERRRAVRDQPTPRVRPLGDRERRRRALRRLPRRPRRGSPAPGLDRSVRALVRVSRLRRVATAWTPRRPATGESPRRRARRRSLGSPRAPGEPRLRCSRPARPAAAVDRAPPGRRRLTLAGSSETTPAPSFAKSSASGLAPRRSRRCSSIARVAPYLVCRSIDRFRADPGSFAPAATLTRSSRRSPRRPRCALADVAFRIVGAAPLEHSAAPLVCLRTVATSRASRFGSDGHSTASFGSTRRRALQHRPRRRSSSASLGRPIVIGSPRRSFGQQLAPEPPGVRRRASLRPRATRARTISGPARRRISTRSKAERFRSPRSSPAPFSSPKMRARSWPSRSPRQRRRASRCRSPSVGPRSPSTTAMRRSCRVAATSWRVSVASPPDARRPPARRRDRLAARARRGAKVSLAAAAAISRTILYEGYRRFIHIERAR